MGPYETGQVREMLQTGILEKYDLYWHEGMLDWAPVASLRNNYANHPPEYTAPSHTTSKNDSIILSGSESLATWSLVLGLLSIFCLGMLAGIPAIVCGHNAISNINKNPFLRGRGSAIAGLILGYLGTIFWLFFGISMLLKNR